jgi:hypothetical protein
MCYTSGPRCSPHSKSQLLDAKKALKENTSDDPKVYKELQREVNLAQKEYLTSPEGIKSLKEKAKRTGKYEDAKRAQMFEKRRKDLIDRSKAIAETNKLEKELSKSDSADREEAPVITEVKNSKLNEPVRHSSNGYFMSDTRLYSVEYEYDGYYCSGSSCGQEGYDDYCRDSQYDNIRVAEGIDSRAVLAELHGCQKEDLPEDLVAYANNELELDNPDSYEVEVTGGYYGDEASVIFSEPEKVYAKLREHYFAREDAKDADGVLPYVRGKGLDTTGLQPLEAIKKQLRTENKGKIVDYVENTTKVERKFISMKNVVVPQNQHFIKADPREPVAPHGAEQTFGVVVQKGDAYVLVDGYHRFKHQTAKGTKNGSFIVLS